MAGVRFTELQSRPREFLDLTSVTLDEFPQLVPPCEAAFPARMAAWRMDGKPRAARRFIVYKNCPLSTPEDRLLFILAYLKMMEAFGGVGVHVTSPEALSRAVNAAMDSGTPTLVNAVIDEKAGTESGRIGNLNPQSVVSRQ